MLDLEDSIIFCLRCNNLSGLHLLIIGQKRKTRVVPNNLDPVWDEVMAKSDR